MKTNEIFRNLNHDFGLRLIPENTEPVECDSFSDLNEDIINYSLKDHGYD